MKPVRPLQVFASRAAPLLLLAATVALVTAPGGFGLSTGANKETIQDPHFEADGCTACHGGTKFAPGGADRVAWTITKSEGGEALAGNRYEADTLYTITITLDETNEPGADNHAGFNLRASAGKLAAVAESSKVTADGTQATHINAASTSWTVEWASPADGPAVFDLFVNDVDGSNVNDAPDMVYRIGFFLTDESSVLPGAAAEHVEFGISLQQYWIGLLGLAGMVFIIIASFLYLKFVNPHNTDARDR